MLSQWLTSENLAMSILRVLRELLEILWNCVPMLPLEVEAQPVPQMTTRSHKNKQRSAKRCETKSAARRDGAQQGDCQRTKIESPADSHRTKHWQEPWSTVNRHSTDHLVLERGNTRGKVLGEEHKGEDGQAKEPATLNLLRGPKLAVGPLYTRREKDELSGGSKEIDLWAVGDQLRRDSWGP